MNLVCFQASDDLSTRLRSWCLWHSWGFCHRCGLMIPRGMRQQDLSKQASVYMAKHSCPVCRTLERCADRSQTMFQTTCEGWTTKARQVHLLLLVPRSCLVCSPTTLSTPPGIKEKKIDLTSSPGGWTPHQARPKQNPTPRSPGSFACISRSGSR